MIDWLHYWRMEEEDGVVVICGDIILRRRANKLIIRMSESRKINPELSVMNEKNELKKLESNVDTMRNRV